MVTKADLHRLIDALPERALPIAERFLAALEADEAAPHLPLQDAPPDDEPETEAELAAVAEAGRRSRAVKSSAMKIWRMSWGCEPARRMVSPCRA